MPKTNNEIDIIFNEVEMSEYLKENKLTDLRLDSSMISVLSQAVSEIPHFMKSKKMDSLYEVVMPKGINGNLMMVDNGKAFTTAVVGDNKRIVAQARLHKIAQGPQIISNLFSVASVATGMYYMDTISKQLENVNCLLTDIKQWLANDKKALIAECMETLKGLYSEYSYAQSNPNLLATNLQIVGNIERQVRKELLFFHSQFSDKINVFNEKSDSKKQVNDNVADIQNYALATYQLLSMLKVATILTIAYNNEYNENYISSKKKQLEKYDLMFKETFDDLKPSIGKYMMNRKATGFEKLKYFVSKENAVALICRDSRDIIGNYYDKKNKDSKERIESINDELFGYDENKEIDACKIIDQLVMMHTNEMRFLISGDKVCIAEKI